MSAVPFQAAARNNMPKTKTYRAWLVGVVLAGVLLLLHSPKISLAQDQDQDQHQGQYQDQQQVSSSRISKATRIRPASPPA